MNRQDAKKTKDRNLAFLASWRLIIGIVATALLLAGARGLWASDGALAGLENIPAVVAEVNGKSLSHYDLLRELIGASGSEAIARIVRRAVIEQTAREELKITVTDEEIEREYAVDKRDLMAELIYMPWDKKYKEFPIEDILQARFRMSVDEYKKLVVRQKLLIRRAVTRGLNPADQELFAFFNSFPDLFQQPAKYRASHILISPLSPYDLHRGLAFRSGASQKASIAADRNRAVGPASSARRRIDLARDHRIDFSDAPEVNNVSPEWQRARESAERVLREIRGGVISWDQAVKKYTQDPLDHPSFDRETRQKMVAHRERVKLPPGDVGWFHRDGPLVKEFYAGAKDLKLNEPGGPVLTPYGYHIIKVTEFQPAPVVTFDQCRDKVLRMWIENVIQERSGDWLDGLLRRVEIKTNHALMWPPAPAAPQVGLPAPAPPEDNDPDPVIVTVSGMPVRRSEVWRELLRSEGDEALNRLINVEVVMTMLKDMGLERLEWESADPARRAAQPPRLAPIVIAAEAVDRALTDDRVRADLEAPGLSFKDFIYQRYGKSVDEFRRAIEAGLILREAVRRRVPADENTLRVQFYLAREQYAIPAWYEISHILIEPNGGQKADDAAQLQARITADHVRANYDEKANNFRFLVSEFSMDDKTRKKEGKLGACYPDRRNPDLPEEALLYHEIRKQNLEPRQVSVPIRSPRGYHIVRVDKVHPEHSVDFNEPGIKDQVERDYLQERAKMYTDVWLRALHAQARVKRHLFPAKEIFNEALPPDNFPLPGK